MQLSLHHKAIWLYYSMAHRQLHDMERYQEEGALHLSIKKVTIPETE
jgi:hypothetical protein